MTDDTASSASYLVSNTHVDACLGLVPIRLHHLNKKFHSAWRFKYTEFMTWEPVLPQIANEDVLSLLRMNEYCALISSILR